MNGSESTYLDDRLAWRECLAGSGLPQVAYRLAGDPGSAAEAFSAFGAPVFVVAPAGGRDGERAVMHEADLSLALRQVTAGQASRDVLIESHERGEIQSVWCHVEDGSARGVKIIRHVTAPAPFRFPVGLRYPSGIEPAGEKKLLDICQGVVEALGFEAGDLRVETIIAEDGPRILDVDAAPRGAWMPVDITRLAGEGSTAGLAWFSSRSGSVVDIEGHDEAREMDGVVDVVVAAHVGDVLGHVIDPASRDKLGYFAAVGPDEESAEAIIERVQQTVRVVTRTML